LIAGAGLVGWKSVMRTTGDIVADSNRAAILGDLGAVAS
jgi:hypothetical protein